MGKTFESTENELDPLAFMIQTKIDLEINEGVDVIFDNLVLPSSINIHAQISWESSHPDIIDIEGHFTQPNETTAISLSAHITAKNLESDKIFNYIVYGISENSSDLPNQKLSKINYSDILPVYQDTFEGLTRGTFDKVIYKNGRLMLSGQTSNGTYTSPAIDTTNTFKSVYLMWGSITSPLAKTSFESRYLTVSGWSDWISHGTWGYGGDNLPPSITTPISEPSHTFQYRVTLIRLNDSTVSPQLTHVSLSFVYDDYNFDIDLNTLRQNVLYDVPQLRQADTLDPFLWRNICWATSISMLLQYHKKLLHRALPQEYYSVLIRQGTERFGTPKNDIGATQFGFGGQEIEFSNKKMLLYFLNHYGPILVGVSKGNSPDGKFGPLTYSTGHVVIVVGYEILNNGSINILLNDPAASQIRHVIGGSIEEFMLVWDHGAYYLHELIQ